MTCQNSLKKSEITSYGFVVTELILMTVKYTPLVAMHYIIQEKVYN